MTLLRIIANGLIIILSKILTRLMKNSCENPLTMYQISVKYNKG